VAKKACVLLCDDGEERSENVEPDDDEALDDVDDEEEEEEEEEEEVEESVRVCICTRSISGVSDICENAECGMWSSRLYLNGASMNESTNQCFLPSVASPSELAMSPKKRNGKEREKAL